MILESGKPGGVMYRCEECKSVFARAAGRYEDTGEWICACPFCGFDSMAEVSECAGCGGYFESHELESRFCNACAGGVWLRLRAAVDGVFDAHEQSLINEMLDGHDLFEQDGVV